MPEIEQYVTDKNYCVLVFFNNVKKIKPFEIDKTGVEPYALEPVASAWEAVKEGEGISYVETSDEVRQVAITRVILAYFDDPIHQNYLQPIYVFYGLTRGVGNAESAFVAYQPAVSQDWISK